jgi:hypothetical protein
MNNRLMKTGKGLLLVAGSLLILVGGFILGAQVEFYASNGIELGADPSLRNELKAPAGLLLVAGLAMIVAVFVRGQADAALWLAALIYLSYAGSRAASMALDGMPAAGLVHAAGLEAILGLACLAVAAIRRLPTPGAV